jgi:hypothetical protein
MDIDVVIEGVTDLTVERAIHERIQRVQKQAARSGEWRVSVFPSETRGEWDLGVQGPSGRHFASFMVTADRLPDLIEGKLSEFLELPSPS